MLRQENHKNKVACSLSTIENTLSFKNIYRFSFSLICVIFLEVHEASVRVIQEGRQTGYP